MALTPETNEAFMREVDEELRREQALTVWRRWGVLIVAVVVLGLAAFGGYLYWQHHQQTVAGERGEKFDAALIALGEDKAKDAEPALADIAKQGNEGYGALARFTQADLKLQKNDLKGAAALFAQVANDTAAPAPFRDLALVRQTAAEYDELKPEVVISRLRGLAIQGNPWFGSAGEMVAAAYLAQGKRDVAGKLYAEIAKDKDVPNSIRQRAVQMAGVLGVDAVDDTGGAAAEKAEEAKTQ